MLTERIYHKLDGEVLSKAQLTITGSEDGEQIDITIQFEFNFYH